MMSEDYQKRAQEFGFAPHQDIKDALANPDTHVLDIRTEQEIADAGRFEHANWRQTNGTATECPALSAAPEDFVKDKQATVVVYCRSGRRALAAVNVLKSKGYEKVLNAGGYDDVVRLMQ